MLKVAAEITKTSIDKVVKAIEQTEKDKEKALNSAIRVTGFRLKNILQKEIRAGAPGGVPFKPLSYIARRLNSSVKTMGGRTARQNPNRKPLARLAIPVRYSVSTVPNYEVAVGFVQPGNGRTPISKSWSYLAEIHQSDFTREISPKLRRMVIRRGGELGKVDGGDTPFFLKKTTRDFKTPARPIIAPFWNKHQIEARAEITRNFKRKMAGERI